MVAFVFSWKVSLVTLPLSLLFLVPGVACGKLLMKVSLEMAQAYGVAGGITDQAISSIRTVFAYVGERQTLDRFSQAHEKATRLGIRQGLLKGILVGSMGIMFAIWAFLAWFMGTLVASGAEGGYVFIAGMTIMICAM